MYTQISKKNFKTLEKDTKKVITSKISDGWDEIQGYFLTLP